MPKEDNQVAQILLQRLAEDFPLDQLILRHQQLALAAYKAQKSEMVSSLTSKLYG